MYTYGYIYTLRKCLQAIYGSIVVGLQMIFKIFSLLIFLYLTPNLYQHIYSYPIVSWPLLKSPQTLEMGPTQQGLGKEGDRTGSLSMHRCQVERSTLPNTGQSHFCKICKHVWGSLTAMHAQAFPEGSIASETKWRWKPPSWSSGTPLGLWGFHCAVLV